MRVALACGAAFHAPHLAYQLQKRSMLARWYTWAYDVREHALLNKSQVTVDGRGRLLNDMYHRLLLARLIPRSYWHVLKDNRFDRWLAKQLRHEPHVDILVGWAHYVENSIAVARSRGAKVVIEMGSAHILLTQTILEAEFSRWGVTYQPIHPKNKDKMLREYELADYIMTPSSFAQNSFYSFGFTSNKVRKVLYGVETAFFVPAEKQDRDIYRVLFVGALSLCKGVPYLLEAWKQAKLPQRQTELVLVGAIRPEVRAILKQYALEPNIRLVGSVSQREVRDWYQRSSLFVLPSLQDGFGMVIGQAMACGLPVVCTPHSAGEDLVEHGKEGFVVPIRDSLALVELLRYGYEHQDRLHEMGLAARQRIERYSWDVYGEAIVREYAWL